MTTTLTSVASAAIIGGDLIMGLSDGSIINCGRVQGPQGLTGDRGPMGATGRDGQDGNTIHTVEGAPDTTLGRDGDYAINVVVWEIYGPRAGGVWGTGTPLRGNTRGGQNPNTTQNLFGSNPPGSDGGGGGKTYTTSNLPLTGTGRVAAPGGNIIPEGLNLTYQSNANKWIVDSLQALDVALPVKKVDALPAEGEYEGDMVFMSGGLYIWLEGVWEGVSGDSDLEARVETIEKAIFPYVTFNDRYCYYNAGGNLTKSSVRIYQYWDSSANGTWTWAWMVKMPGTDTWVDVDDMSTEQAVEIGYLGDEDGVYLFLYPPNEDDMPDIEVKMKVTDELEGFPTAEEWSESFFPRQNWVNKDTNSSVRSAMNVAAKTKKGRGKITLHQP